MGDSSCFANYKNLVSIYESSHIEGILSVEAKTETQIETPMYRMGEK